jgi:hypothetical protein
MRGLGNLFFMAAGLLVLVMNVAIYQYGGRIMEMFSPSDPLRGSEVTILGHRTDHGFQDGYLQTAAHDRMYPGRHVTVSTLVPVRALLDRGESPPAAGDMSLFASARTALYAQTECERLLKTLASQCEVRRADGRLSQDHVAMSIVLACRATRQTDPRPT